MCEVVLNVIKYVNVSEIVVSCVIVFDGDYIVYICDNGIGIGELYEFVGYYGLNIMCECVEWFGGMLNFL